MVNFRDNLTPYKGYSITSINHGSYYAASRVINPEKEKILTKDNYYILNFDKDTFPIPRKYDLTSMHKQINELVKNNRLSNNEIWNLMNYAKKLPDNQKETFWNTLQILGVKNEFKKYYDYFLKE